MDMNQYMEIFIEEATEHLQNLNQCLLALETNPKDSKIINEIFRSAHTLKGMSGTMGFLKMQELTHNMENVLDIIRNGKLDVNSEIIDVLFECLDYLENATETINNTGVESNRPTEESIKKLNLILSGESAAKAEKTPEIVASKVTPEVKPMNKDSVGLDLNQYDLDLLFNAAQSSTYAYKIKIVLAENCMLKAARAFIIFQALEESGEIFKSVPKVEDIEDEKFDNSFVVALLTKETLEKVRKDLENITDVAQVVIEEIAVDEIVIEENVSKSIADGRAVAQGLIDDANNIMSQVASALTAPLAGIAVAEGAEVAEDGTKKAAKASKTVRVDIDRLDNLMNLVSELIIIKTRLEGLGAGNRDSDMNEAVEYLERITTNLHDAVMKVRMVPIERVFNRFPRMVRDLSRDLKKDIVLQMSGEETELDRTVIDEIGDPLIHLIRNAIDHGVESKEDRINSGKSSTGNVFLRAYQDGNSVVIEVEDDGAGINVENVRRKALEKGLITVAEANEMDEKTSIELLFKAGFSTADKVSNLSGRGVGLDVVKTKIESLNGVVEVENIKGKGSKFIIRLPLTLAIIQALLVTIGDEKYAIPLNSIRDITTISKDLVRDIHGQEVVLNRNSVLPIVRLNRMLDVEGSASENVTEYTAIVVKKGDKNTAFIVDSLIGQQEIVIKTLGKFLSGIKFIAGATILGDGQVALIVDTNSLI